MPSGLKNKMVNLHTTTTEVKIDHTIRPLLTYTAPPKLPKKDTHFFSGGEGIIWPPPPCVDHKEVPVIELLLYDWSEVYQCATKIKQI